MSIEIVLVGQCLNTVEEHASIEVHSFSAEEAFNTVERPSNTADNSDPSAIPISAVAEEIYPVKTDENEMPRRLFCRLSSVTLKPGKHSNANAVRRSPRFVS